MANTNFAALTTEELTIWSRDFWTSARNNSFVSQYMGARSNSVIQRITDLRKTRKGARAVMTLVADLTGDGVTGDYTLEGREESMQSFDQVIRIDQLRNATRSEGRLAEQKSVVMFREESRDKLAYWMGDRIDQIAFLTMAGISYAYTNNGALRNDSGVTGLKLADLEFNADVTAPTTNRHVRWDAANDTLQTGSTSSVTAADKLEYKTIVRLKEYAKNNYIRGVRADRNSEMFYLFVTPSQFADLLLDSEFQNHLRQAAPRSKRNTLFAGADTLMVDGCMIAQHRHVPNVSEATTGTARNAGSAGYKWGAKANVNGARALFCGAQALGMVDLDGSTVWDEEEYDYGNQAGIAAGRMIGFLKPRFKATPKYESTEDFGLVAVDTAQ